jgi:hypothetical protein
MANPNTLCVIKSSPPSIFQRPYHPLLFPTMAAFAKQAISEPTISTRHRNSSTRCKSWSTLKSSFGQLSQTHPVGGRNWPDDHSANHPSNVSRDRGNQSPAAQGQSPVPPTYHRLLARQVLPTIPKSNFRIKLNEMDYVYAPADILLIAQEAWLEVTSQNNKA